jgi:hypothetical protein
VIEISASAWPAHEKHGDLGPGDPLLVGKSKGDKITKFVADSTPQ